MSKIEFDETEIAWILHMLSKYWVLENIAKVMRLLTARFPTNSKYELPSVPKEPPLEKDKA